MSRSRRVGVSLLVAAALCVCTQHSIADTIINGSFEETNGLTGWTVGQSGSSSSVTICSYGSEGTHCAELYATAEGGGMSSVGLSQSVAVTAGQQLKFDYSGWTQLPSEGTAWLMVDLSIGTWFQSLTLSVESEFTAYSYTLPVTGDLSLSFVCQALSMAPSGMEEQPTSMPSVACLVIDNVRVTPEPASLGLLGTMAALVGGYVWWKRRR
ncbi:MAG: PEP-CTERM sorting domain-containing protein [Thermoguttaceae bacterium]